MKSLMYNTESRPISRDNDHRNVATLVSESPASCHVGAFDDPSKADSQPPAGSERVLAYEKNTVGSSGKQLVDFGKPDVPRIATLVGLNPVVRVSKQVGFVIQTRRSEVCEAAALGETDLALEDSRGRDTKQSGIEIDAHPSPNRRGVLVREHREDLKIAKGQVSEETAFPEVERIAQVPKIHGTSFDRVFRLILTFTPQGRPSTLISDLPARQSGP